MGSQQEQDESVPSAHDQLLSSSSVTPEGQQHHGDGYEMGTASPPHPTPMGGGPPCLPSKGKPPGRLSRRPWSRLQRLRFRPGRQGSLGSHPHPTLITEQKLSLSMADGESLGPSALIPARCPSYALQGVTEKRHPGLAPAQEPWCGHLAQQKRKAIKTDGSK